MSRDTLFNCRDCIPVVLKLYYAGIALNKGSSLPLPVVADLIHR